jgi:hypothetical protein
MKNKENSTVIRVTWLHELQPFKIALEQEGIECFITDNIDAANDPFSANAMGRIQLKVSKDDYIKSIEVIKSIELKRKRERRV